MPSDSKAQERICSGPQDAGNPVELRVKSPYGTRTVMVPPMNNVYVRFFRASKKFLFMIVWIRHDRACAQFKCRFAEGAVIVCSSTMLMDFCFMVSTF